LRVLLDVDVHWAYPRYRSLGGEMVNYPQRVRENILPLSRIQTLPAAFKEWHWTGLTEDHGRPTEICQLCEQESLRYHFEICNSETQKVLQVGSQCILKFDVGVYEGAYRLEPKEARAKLAATVKGMQRQACLTALRQLSIDDPNPIMSTALVSYEADKPLTPKQANVVLWRLREARIEHNPSFFKVRLSKDTDKAALRDMRDFQRANVWKALTSAQRIAAVKFGAIPPPDPTS
jgi:hypothetical protein